MREIRWPKYQWCSLHNYNIGVDCPSCERASIANTNIEACIKAWQEAQAGEYIKQAVDNGYSLKSDKPPLSALDAQELSAFICEWYKIEKISFLYDGVNILSKAICSKFGTPPSVRKVSVEEIRNILVEHLTLLYETYKQCQRDYDNCAQSIVDYLEGKGGR